MEHVKNRTQWEETDHLINRWLVDRKRLLSLYFRLTSHLRKKPTVDEMLKHVDPLLNLLVDYASTVHFKILEQVALVQAAAYPKQGGLEKDLIGKVLRNTMQILDCNEFFVAARDEKPSLKQVEERLSHLGEHLAQRFELEDCVVGTYLKAKRVLKNQSADLSPTPSVEPERRRPRPS